MPPRKVATSKRTSIGSTTSQAIRKRKENDLSLVEEHADDDRRPSKKSRIGASPGKRSSGREILNERPTQLLDVFVFGEGSNSELGLGPAKSAIDVKRPRLNPFLAANQVGVVSLACGGMHTLALTHKGEVLSWGVNDNGALGRSTAWEGGLRDVKDESDNDSDDEDDSGLNPHESTPGHVDFSAKVNIVKLAAGDSISLALTDDGRVYGWGTFRNHSGVLGFYQAPHSGSRRATINASALIENQPVPHLYGELTGITDIACGSNHCLALSAAGQIYVWGCGEQNQLGHHINERLDVEGKACLVPSLLRTGRRKYRAIYSGADHAFAIDIHDHVWSWGLNSFGATGIPEGAGEDNAAIYVPSLVKSLSDPVAFICGGQHHSIAVMTDGRALIFGRLDGLQTGLDISSIPAESIIYDDAEPPKARILIKPTALPAVGTRVVYASAGVDHSIVVNDEGKSYSWGISINYQTGLGKTEDVPSPTLIDNTAVREKKLIWSGCGGQFSMLAAAAEPRVNGVHD